MKPRFIPKQNCKETPCVNPALAQICAALSAVCSLYSAVYIFLSKWELSKGGFFLGKDPKIKYADDVRTAKTCDCASGSDLMMSLEGGGSIPAVGYTARLIHLLVEVAAYQEPVTPGKGLRHMT